MRSTQNKQDALSMLPTIMKRIREAVGSTQYGVAVLLGVSRQLLAQWETGESTPSKEQLSNWLDMMCQDISAHSMRYDKIDKLVKEEADSLTKRQERNIGGS